ncbi:MAG: hypothetical protein E6248_02620 [Clostridium sp.]|uniref:hypothetical protein n=1 Tax=Clostridium sp. TaxID=1506 RepID=UPI002911B16B|nr:hypothetical protein [Clostridium sp.]MDU5109313.1 hypothetical protein [Clostridium sp.]
MVSKKVIFTFIFSLIISYLIIGYLNSNLFVIIDWIEGVTIVDKLREYYIRTFSSNISLSLPISLILTYIVYKKTKNKTME